MGPTPSGFSRLSSTAQGKDSLSAKPAERGTIADTLPLVGMILNSKSHRNLHSAEDQPDMSGVLTAIPGSRQDIEDALALFAKRKIGLLAISGGDGTIRDVLTRGAPVFGDNWPTIIILPQGKTNALALDLGLPRKWTLASALEAAHRGRTVTRRPLAVEARSNDQRTRYGFILGAGVFNTAIEAGQVAHRYGAFQSFAVGVTAVFGVLQALFGVGKSLFRKPARMNIRSGPNGNELPHSIHGKPGERLIAGFSALTVFPPGLRPFKRMPDQDSIRYFILDAPIRRAVVLFPFALFGMVFPVMKSLGLHRGSGSSFDLDMAENYILDGEAFPPGSYRLSLGPEIEFIVP